jgi:hypothetical protein
LDNKNRVLRGDVMVEIILALFFVVVIAILIFLNIAMIYVFATERDMSILAKILIILFLVLTLATLGALEFETFNLVF